MNNININIGDTAFVDLSLSNVGDEPTVAASFSYKH